MKKLNKKGFTLIELMAVVIVLIIVIFLAINKVNRTTKDARNNAIKANAISYVKRVDSYIDESTGIYQFQNALLTVSDLKSKGVTVSGTNPDSGYVLTNNFDITDGCLIYGQNHVTITNGNVDDPKKGACPSTIASFDFEYTGSETVFNIPASGKYVFEVWGAQGGYAIDRPGGYGAYATGTINLNSDDVLYINVGGKGLTSPNNSNVLYNGGYNGGGKSHSDGATAWGSGGGASSISLMSGELKDVSLQNVLIVAGGGGGGGTYSGSFNKGGNAGGIAGNNGEGSQPGYGGTQTSGGAGNGNNAVSGSFGLGGGAGGYSSGGGGGFYGGGTGYGSGSGGGGGSSYIGNSSLTNKVMYCYSCAESSDENTKTISRTCVNESPQSRCSKSGDGFIRISLIN